MSARKRSDYPGHDYWLVPAHVDLLIEASDASDAKRKAVKALKKVEWLDTISKKSIHIIPEYIYQPDSVPD